MISDLLKVVFVGLLFSGCTSKEHNFLEDDLFLTGVTIIDVVDGSEVAKQTIAIRGGRIIEIVPDTQINLPSSAQILATGGYVVPGLWDMHVHTMTDPDVALDYFFPLFIANGVTGVRDMGSVVDGIVETRSRIESDASIVAPHLYVSGPLLDGQALPWYGDLPLVLKTAEDVNRELPKLKAAGMDFFKVYDALPAEAYDAVIAYGEAHNIPVAGHSPKGINLAGAGKAGQRTVEHLSPFGFRDCFADADEWFKRSIDAKFRQGAQAYYEVTQELFDELDRDSCWAAFKSMAEGGTRFSPTLVMELNDRSRVPEADLAYLQPSAREWCQAGLTGIDKANPELREKVYSGYGELLNEIRETGVTVIAGSDVPNNCLVPGFSLHWELERLVEVGFTPLEALQSATLHAADVMGRVEELGQVAPGYIADLVLLEENPLNDIDHLRSLQGVMSKGKWVNGDDRAVMMRSVLEKLASE